MNSLAYMMLNVSHGIEGLYFMHDLVTDTKLVANNIVDKRNFYRGKHHV